MPYASRARRDPRRGEKTDADAGAAARVARIWRSCASDARWRDCRAGLARDLPSRAPRDAPWRTRRRRSSTRTSWRAPPRRRGRSGTRPSCLCAHGRDCVSRPSPRGAFVARTRDAPLAWLLGSSLLVDAIHLGVVGRDRETFSGSGLFKPRTTSQGVETEPKRRSVYVAPRTRRSLWKFGKFGTPEIRLSVQRVANFNRGSFGEPR